MKTELLKKRFEFLKLIRTFFENNQYLEVETPIMAPYATLDANIEPIKCYYQGKTLYLQTSPEYYMKELLTYGFKKIFQINKVFRHDIITPLHHPEFTMLEWYEINKDYFYTMDFTQKLIIFLANKLKIKLKPFKKISIKELFKKYVKVDLSNYFDKKKLFELCKKNNLNPNGNDNWCDLFFRIFLNIIEPNIKNENIFIYDYPEPLGAMAKPKFNDHFYTERFELYMDGIEICNGYSELTDPQLQFKRFKRELNERKEKGLTQYKINDRFLNCLKNLPECSGNALGVDRLFMVLTKQNNIYSSLPFNLALH